MSELLFIRHAETDMAGTFCGHSDPPINERGYEQLRTLVAELRGSSIDAIFSSDLQRAASTGDALAASFDIPVSLNSGLREIYFGEWEGLTWHDIERRDSSYAQRWLEHYPQLAPPGGEAFIDFQARVLNKVTELSKSTDHRCIAIVTHGGVMRIVLRALCGLNEQEAWERTKQYCCSFLYIPGVGMSEKRTALKEGGAA